MIEPAHVVTARDAYDGTADLYVQFIGTEINSSIEADLDRAVLESFADGLATASEPPTGPVADIGCGPGRAAAFLAARGLDVVGFDVSTAMLDLARAAHPSLRFEEGSLTRLPVADGSLAGAVCWYSIIHTPPDARDEVMVELARVLAPGAPLLVAFQAGGGEAVHRTEVLGRAVSLTSHRHDPSDVVRRLDAAGFVVDAPVVRAAVGDHESTQQAFVTAHAPTARPG
jgi:SAM-dependent methyltransferase